MCVGMEVTCLKRVTQTSNTLSTVFEKLYLDLYSGFATDPGDLLKTIQDHCLVLISKRTKKNVVNLLYNTVEWSGVI